MNSSLRTTLAVVFIAIITVCSTLIVSKLAGRRRVADLTERGLYTLSDGTKRLVAKINQPITLKLYYSRVAARKGPEQIRFWNNYYLYVRDLLEEYVSISGGTLTLEVIDPRPFSEEADEADGYSISSFPLSGDEKFYFGLAAVTELGKDEVIKFFEPNRQEFVEYDISKTLGSLLRKDKRKVGIISSLPVLGTDMSPYMMQMLRMQGRQPDPPWTIVQHLRQNYEIEKVELEDHAIPSDIDFLMVVHPKKLGEGMRFAIDQYVMKGGKLVVFVDPHCMVDRPPPNPQNPYAGMSHKADSELASLLENWGVKMGQDLITVDRAIAVTAQTDRSRPPAPILPYLNLSSECMSEDQVITAELRSLRLLFAGSLSKVGGKGTTVEPLLQTTSIGSTWKPSGPFELRFPDPVKISNAVIDGTEPVMLGCVVTGKFKTNFPDGYTVKDEPEDSGPPRGMPPGMGMGGMPMMGPRGEPGGEGKAAPAEKKEPAPAAKAEPEAEAKKEDAPKAKDDAEPEPADDKKAEEDKKAEADEKAEDDKKDEEPEEPEFIESVKESAEGAMVIVVADVDLITDPMCYERTFFGQTQVGDNASFLFNTLDYLSGADELISVRSRGRYSRPFDVIEEIERRAQKATDKEEKELNDKIEDFKKQLRELGSVATEENIAVIENEALKKQRELQAEIRKADKALRVLKKNRREEVEALERKLEWLNMLVAPLVILLIAIVLAGFRWAAAKRYAARRT